MVDELLIVSVPPPMNGIHLYGAETVTCTGSPIWPFVPVGPVRNETQTCAGDVTDPVPLRSSFDKACCWIQLLRSPPG